MALFGWKCCFITCLETSYACYVSCRMGLDTNLLLNNAQLLSISAGCSHEVVWWEWFPSHIHSSGFPGFSWFSNKTQQTCNYYYYLHRQICVLPLVATFPETHSVSSIRILVNKFLCILRYTWKCNHSWTHVTAQGFYCTLCLACLKVHHPTLLNDIWVVLDCISSTDYIVQRVLQEGSHSKNSLRATIPKTKHATTVPQKPETQTGFWAQSLINEFGKIVSWLRRQIRVIWQRIIGMECLGCLGLCWSPCCMSRSWGRIRRCGRVLVRMWRPRMEARILYPGEDVNQLLRRVLWQVWR